MAAYIYFDIQDLSLDIISKLIIIFKGRFQYLKLKDSTVSDRRRAAQRRRG
jgi:hypothetical protein